MTVTRPEVKVRSGRVPRPGERAALRPVERRIERRFQRSPRSLWLLLVAAIGIGLAAVPFAFGMFVRTPHAAKMLANFRPYLNETRVDGLRTDIETVNRAITEVRTSDLPHTAPDYAALRRQWPQIHTTMSDLLDTLHQNVSNYRAATALPNFALFPWLLLLPGLLITLFAGYARAHPDYDRPMRRALTVLGITLVLAPVASGLFTHAARTGRMVNDFATIETVSKVRQLQRDFATMAAGQGDIRIAALSKQASLTPTQAQARYPAAAALDANWVHILNDLTPLIGAISDNVGNYNAVTALPPIPLVPWFLAAPGMLAATSAITSRRNRSRRGVLP